LLIADKLPGKIMPELYREMLLMILKKWQDARFYGKSKNGHPQKGEFIFV